MKNEIIKWTGLTLGFISTLVLLSACGGGGGGGGGGDGGGDVNVAPSVSSVTPANNTQDIDETQDIVVTVTFSEPMDLATLIETNIYIQDAALAAYGAGTLVIVDSQNVKITIPLAELSANTILAATVSAFVKDASGLAMEADYTWTFNTTSPPTVISTIPANGSVGVARDTTLTIVFSEPMTTTTVDVSNVKLFDVTAGATFPAGITLDNYDPATHTAVFSLNGILAEGNDYEITIYGDGVSGVQDAKGNYLDEAINGYVAFTFTTLVLVPPGP